MLEEVRRNEINIMNIILDNIWESPVLSSLICSTLVACLVLLYQYNRNAYTFWQKRSIDGPKPWPIVGNFLQMILSNRMELERGWAQKYGKVYGIYQGRRPTLVVADAEVLQQICVKDFDAFPNHSVNEFFNHYQKSFLIFLQDEHWKRSRALMSPTFTSGKIKRMFRFLDACADDLVDCFGEQVGSGSPARKEVNVKDIYNLFTMDAITTCCYGLKLERVTGSSDLKSAATRNDFVRLSMRIFKSSITRFFVYISAPKSLLRLIDFRVSNPNKYENLAVVVKQLVEQRRNQSNQKKYDDYLQLLVDAKLNDEMELNEMDLEENHHAGLTHESLRRDQKMLAQQSTESSSSSSTSSLNQNNKQQQVLSEIEIVSGAMFLLVVGLETTASLLTNCTYFLAHNPQVQEKLYEEVKKIAEYKDDKKTRTLFSYEALTSCRYLDSVISETLRFFTAVTNIDRIADRDYYLAKYNVHLPKGTLISNALYATMNDPDYWPEPDKFDPERFMPGNKEKIVPGSYCPFGLGPRHCLGMRFSLTEGKLALAKTIMKYRFEPAPGTNNPPDLKLSLGLTNMKKPHVMMVAR